jgi:hypothetical protein
MYLFDSQANIEQRSKMPEDSRKPESGQVTKGRPAGFVRGLGRNHVPVCSSTTLSEKVVSQEIICGRIDSIAMATLSEFKCEICGIVTENPIHWFVIECGDLKLSVHKWSVEAANGAGARHFCGERHAQVFISRWFDSVCVPPKPA